MGFHKSVYSRILDLRIKKKKKKKEILHKGLALVGGGKLSVSIKRLIQISAVDEVKKADV